MAFEHGISPADIYLPAPGADLTRWAVIACDQYTSQRDYWDKVQSFVGGAPSSLNIIQPEIDLERAPERLSFVRRSMQSYIDGGVIRQSVTNGFALTLRRTSSGLRPGLIGKVDLDAYEFAPGNTKPIRASEGTIIERLPPRIKIREGAPLECPHIMLLVDDPEGQLVERAYKAVQGSSPLYDFELMAGGGHLTGWAIEDEATKRQIDAALDRLYSVGEGFLAAVGDGNHSLATAKACWDRIKPGLSSEQLKNHPARFALVEIVNLHCPALIFRPIHRAVFGADTAALEKDLGSWLLKKGRKLVPGDSFCFVGGGAYSVEGLADVLPTVYLQPWLDEHVSSHPGVTLDYVHGDEALKSVCASQNAAGILLGTIDKNALFPSVKLSGVLPRKSFSMGEADEKRFYMESRLIRC